MNMAQVGLVMSCYFAHTGLRRAGCYKYTSCMRGTLWGYGLHKNVHQPLFPEELTAKHTKAL